jgi:hypothetical protein
MDFGHILRRGGYLLGLALLFTGPLMYMNVDLIRQGFKPSQAGLSIHANRDAEKYDQVYLPEEE